MYCTCGTCYYHRYNKEDDGTYKWYCDCPRSDKYDHEVKNEDQCKDFANRVRFS